jgi:hypothetical protein
MTKKIQGILDYSKIVSIFFHTNMFFEIFKKIINSIIIVKAAKVLTPTMRIWMKCHPFFSSSFSRHLTYPPPFLF